MNHNRRTPATAFELTLAQGDLLDVRGAHKAALAVEQALASIGYSGTASGLRSGSRQQQAAKAVTIATPTARFF